MREIEQLTKELEAVKKERDDAINLLKEVLRSKCLSTAMQHHMLEADIDELLSRLSSGETKVE